MVQWVSALAALEFGSQHPLGTSQLPATLVPEDVMPSLSTCTHMHIYIQFFF